MSENAESPLKREFEYYIANQDALVKKYNGRYIVIKEQQVIADYADESTAVFETQKTHPLGTFLVQRVAPGTDAYTQTFHSRVIFAG
jgi:hypothetical protein